MVAVRCLCIPDSILCIWIVSADHDLTAFSNRSLVPFDGHRSHHRLTGETESSRRTVVECIPLSVDLLDTSMGVVGCISSYEGRSVFIEDDTA